MIFSDLYGTQLDIELASADRTQLFTTARRKKAINDAMDNFVRTTHCLPIFGTIPIVSTTAEYDLLATFADFISLADNASPSIKIVDASSNVRWIQGDDLPRRTPEWLDRENQNWRADSSSTPNSWYLRDDAGTTYLGMDPPPLIPSGYTYSWLVPYLATAKTLSGDNDVPFTATAANKPFLRLQTYHQALVHYAAALLETARKNYPGADRQMKLYAGYIAQYETKQLKDGPSQVTYARNYYRDASKSVRAVDPHRFP